MSGKNQGCKTRDLKAVPKRLTLNPDHPYHQDLAQFFAFKLAERSRLAE
jgi:hypothetical protein